MFECTATLSPTWARWDVTFIGILEPLHTEFQAEFLIQYIVAFSDAREHQTLRWEKGHRSTSCLVWLHKRKKDLCKRKKGNANDDEVDEVTEEDD